MSQIIEFSEVSNVSSPSLSPTSVASPLSDDMDSNVSWFIDRDPDHNIPRLLNDNNIINYTNYNNYNNYNTYINSIYNELSYEIIPTNNLYQQRQPIDVKCDIIEISKEEQDCCICMETREKEEICQLNCNHKLCEVCIKQLLYKNKISRMQTTCPFCRETITTIKTQKNDIQNEINEKCN